MHSARRGATTVAIAVVALLGAACSQSDAGEGEIASGAASTSTPSRTAPQSTSESPTSSATTPAASTTAPTRTVTRTKVVAPSSGSAAGTTRSGLDAVFRSATPVDPEPYTGAHPNVFFQTPTGNIGCYIFDEDGENRIECTIGHYDFPQPGADCPKGAVLTLDHGNEPSRPACSPSGLFDDPTDVLPYGRSIANGSLGCASEKSGVVCLDLDSGAGFTLSRESYHPVH